MESPERELLRSQPSPDNSSCISPPSVKGFPPPAPLLFTPSKNQDGTETPAIDVEDSAEEPINVDEKVCENVTKGGCDVEAEEDEEDGVSGWKADILRKLKVVRDLPAEEMNVEF